MTPFAKRDRSIFGGSLVDLTSLDGVGSEGWLRPPREVAITLNSYLQPFSKPVIVAVGFLFGLNFSAYSSHSGSPFRRYSTKYPLKSGDETAGQRREALSLSTLVNSTSSGALGRDCGSSSVGPAIVTDVVTQFVLEERLPQESEGE